MEIIITIFSLIVLLFSVIIHELAHGYVAYSLGDPTAKYAGRLTMNPIKHLDLFGSVLLPLFLFFANSPFLIGWAKPVPINPHNFRDQKWGSLKVAVAGPATNIALAVVFGVLIRIAVGFNLLGDIFTGEKIIAMFASVVIINLVLAVFNLVPIPPLDGHWILFRFLPPQFNEAKDFLQRYGFFILLFFIFFASRWLSVIVGYLFTLITGIP